MNQPNRKLNAGQVAEIKDLYSGYSSDIQYLSKVFKVHRTTIEWIVDHNDRRRKMQGYTNKWRRKNPDKAHAIDKKAGIKYRSSEKGKKKLKEYYLKNKKRILAYHRKRYREKHPLKKTSIVSKINEWLKKIK